MGEWDEAMVRTVILSLYAICLILFYRQGSAVASEGQQDLCHTTDKDSFIQALLLRSAVQDVAASRGGISFVRIIGLINFFFASFESPSITALTSGSCAMRGSDAGTPMRFPFGPPADTWLVLGLPFRILEPGSEPPGVP